MNISPQMTKRGRELSRWLLTAVFVAVAAMGCRIDRTTNPAPAKSEATTPAAPRNPASNEPLTLDIARFYHEITTQPASLLKAFSGRQIIDGLPFEIGGQAILFGQTVAERHLMELPDAFAGIRIGRAFDELHLIHHVEWPDAEGQTVARVRLNYADGTKYEVPILYGGQVRDWFRLPSEAEETLTDPDTKVCWRRPPAEYKATIRLFKSRLSNPYPQKLVDTMDVISARSLGSYTLVAATVANRDPNRPTTPPVPADEPERHFDAKLSVRVMDKETGQPIQGALGYPYVTVDDVGVVGSPFYTSAGGEGAVRYPEKGTSGVSVVVTKDGYTEGTAQWQQGSIPDQFTFRLTRATGKIGGAFVPKAIKNLKVGDTAPGFSVKTLDDKPLKLSDFRGKYVLLDFWATWCGPCVGETPDLKETYDAFGKNDRFVMISLSLDPDVEAPRKFARNRDMQWLQGFLGEWSKDTVTKDYSVYGIPSIFLLDPDGKIVALNLRGSAIRSAVAAVLDSK